MARKARLLYFIALLPLLLTSCDGLFPKGAQEKEKEISRPAKVKVKRYSLNDYITRSNDVLAQLLEGKEADSVRDEIAIMNKYAAQKNNPGNVQNVVVLTVEVKKRRGEYMLLVPVDAKGSLSNKTALKKAFGQLQGTKYTMENVLPAKVTFSAPLAIKLPQELSADYLIDTIQKNHAQWIKGSTQLSSYQNAKLLSQLTEYFLEAKQRDPAYLSLDNARQALAQASTAKGRDEEAIKTLNAKLDILETRLRKEMPFSFFN